MNDEQRLVDAVKRIGAASGSNAKLALLNTFADVPYFKEIMRFIYNPYHRTGIGAAKLSSSTLTVPARMNIPQMLEYFATHTTGSAGDVYVAAGFMRYMAEQAGEDGRHLAAAIITQDLKIGVTSTSLNKVYGADFIPKVGCMLGTLFGDVPASKITWPCIVTEKLDGIRRILIKENGVCSFYSRSGHFDDGLVDICKEAEKLPDNCVYDGELLAIGDFKDSIALRQATNSLANSKGRKTGLTFNVFDMLPLNEFYVGRSKYHAIDRKIMLGATFGDEGIQCLTDEWPKFIAAFSLDAGLQFIKPVPVLGLVNSLDEAEPIVNEIWKRGGEGIMLNCADGFYEIKRSKKLLKVKHTEEYVLEVTDIFEGTGKYENAMGALEVVYYDEHDNPYYVGVGSGFTDAQRVQIWANPKAYIGRRVEVETFGVSINQQGTLSLNCPIFKRFVGEAE